MDELAEPLRSLDQAWRVINRDALNPSKDRSKPINKTNYKEKNSLNIPGGKKKKLKINEKNSRLFFHVKKTILLVMEKRNIQGIVFMAH